MSDFCTKDTAPLVGLRKKRTYPLHVSQVTSAPSKLLVNTNAFALCMQIALLSSSGLGRITPDGRMETFYTNPIESSLLNSTGSSLEYCEDSPVRCSACLCALPMHIHCQRGKPLFEALRSRAEHRLGGTPSQKLLHLGSPTLGMTCRGSSDLDWSCLI
jgi:hypothetical protein